jgi:hypothetical protein
VVFLIEKEVEEMKLVLVFVVLVFVCSGVLAVSGISPASYEIDFEPGYNGEFAFDFVIEGGASAELYVEGDLAEYVSFNRRSVSGMEEVVVKLKLPSEIDSPGINYIRFGARGDGVDVGGVIKVNVPYPENYVEVGLNAPNANVGESIIFELELFGRGNETVVVSPRVEVYKDGKSLNIVGVDDVSVVPGEETSVNVSFDTEGYSIGDYLAIAFVDYQGERVSVENPFRLGGYSVELIDYTKRFRENKIDRFEVVVRSQWDGDMDEVYAEVNVLDFPSASFVTSSEYLAAWDSRTLVGFLDLVEISGYKFDAEIILHYGDETVSEIVELRVAKGFDYIIWFVVPIFVVVVGLLVWRGVVFVRRFRKRTKK